MSSDRDQGLTIEIVNEQLVITIGIDALMTAVRAGDDWDDERTTIVDPAKFAAEIADAIENDEESDGTTPLHLVLDRAAEYAIANGSEAVRLQGEVRDDD